jgi:hypothetical protein
MGPRERTENNVAGTATTSINIMQCDLRRMIQINDQTRKYFLIPMSTDQTSGTQAPGPNPTSQRGGLVTITYTTVDTGERKQMFGFTARHLKSTMTTDSSPDACQQQHSKMELDGWYINLEYGVNCGNAQWNYQPDCRDRYEYKHTGPALTYPLQQTTTIYQPNGQTFTTALEVTDLSRQTLDAKLFDVPAGYTEAKNMQELYMAADTSTSDVNISLSDQPNRDQPKPPPAQAPAAANTPPSTVAPSSMRVGVVIFSNKTKAFVSAESLRDQLVEGLDSNGVDAIALNTSSLTEAAAEARARGCGYVLYTDISILNNGSTGKKIGGLLGRAAGVDIGDTSKGEARLDFRLVPVGSSSPLLRSSAGAREESQDASMTMALQNEVRAISDTVKRPS